MRKNEKEKIDCQLDFLYSNGVSLGSVLCHVSWWLLSLTRALQLTLKANAKGNRF